MPLTRTEFWATRELHDYLIAHANDPFAWGTTDCCLFPTNAIQAFTGVDLAADFRGQYNSQAGAFALIKKLTGGTTVADAAVYTAGKHDLVEYKSPLLAKRGDLVVVQDADQLIAGIVHLNGRHVISTGPDGPVRLPLTAVTRAWQI